MADGEKRESERPGRLAQLTAAWRKLRLWLAQRNLQVQSFGGISFVRVPKGKFVMGAKEDTLVAYPDERPRHTVEIPYDFEVARFPVTNDQFAKFIEATHYVTKAEQEGGWSHEEDRYVNGFDWRHPLGPQSSLKDKGDHPVVQVSWYDAIEYCKWLDQVVHGQVGDWTIRLPTEAEWEKAARGQHGNVWPWGDKFDPAKCNSSEGRRGGTTPVGAYSPQGDSPCGAAGRFSPLCGSLARRAAPGCSLTFVTAIWAFGF